jgi:hypothetical protein
MSMILLPDRVHRDLSSDCFMDAFPWEIRRVPGKVYMNTDGV